MNTSFQDFANWSNTWASMGKAAQPFFDLQKINSTTVEQLIQENVSLWSDNMGNYVKLMQNINKTNRPDELTREWMTYFTEQGNRNLQYIQNLLEIAKQTMQESTYSMQGKMDQMFTEQESAMHPHQKRQKS